MMTRLALIVFLLAVVAPGQAGADSWPAPQVKEVFCKSREWFVRVVPGQSIGDTFGFAGSPKGPYSRAEFYQRQTDRSYRLVTEITLLNPVAPMLFLVTDRGYLVTLDNWHNMGYGKAVVSYSPRGRAVVSYELKDMFSDKEIDAFRHSVSSIWWRTETVYVNEGQQSIYVHLDQPGSGLVLEPETGVWQYCSARQQHLCRDAKTGAWRPYQEPKLRR